MKANFHQVNRQSKSEAMLIGNPSNSPVLAAYVPPSTADPLHCHLLSLTLMLSLIPHTPQTHIKHICKTYHSDLITIKEPNASSTPAIPHCSMSLLHASGQYEIDLLACVPLASRTPSLTNIGLPIILKFAIKLFLPRSLPLDLLVRTTLFSYDANVRCFIKGILFLTSTMLRRSRTYILSVSRISMTTRSR